MNTLNRRYLKRLLLIIYCVVMVASFSNEISAKDLFDNAAFTGKVKHKMPVGPGELQLSYNGYSSYDISIPGTFSNDTIYNGSFLGIQGTFRYSLKKSEKKYPVGFGLYQHDRYFPVLTIWVIEGKAYGLDCFERPYDLELHNSPEITLSYRYGNNESQGYVISMPQWIVEMDGENGETVSFQIEPYNRNKQGELSISWIKTKTPEYEFTYNQKKSKGLLYAYNNGDVATLDHRGNQGYRFQLKDGSILSHEVGAKTSSLIYPDKSLYSGTFCEIGKVNLNHNSDDFRKVRELLNSLSDSNELHFYTGTLTRSDGTTIKFIEGKTEHQIEKERLAKEQSEREAYQEQERQENAKAQAKYRAYVKRYGERTAKAIKEDEPFVGMSESAFREIDGSYYVYEQSVNGTTYARKSWFKGNQYFKNGFISGYVVCQGGKIVRIINL